MGIVYYYKAVQYYCACCGNMMRNDFLPPTPSAVTPRVIQFVSECKNPSCEQFGLPVPTPLGEYNDGQ